MCRKHIFMLFLIGLSVGESQFYDFFSGLHPFIQTFQTTTQPYYFTQTDGKHHNEKLDGKRHSYGEEIEKRTTLEHTTRATRTKLTTRKDINAKPYNEVSNQYENNIYSTTKSYITKTHRTTEKYVGEESIDKRKSNNRDEDKQADGRYNLKQPYDFTTHKAGVIPADVDDSRPPITNRPLSLQVFPRPTDSSVIRYPEDPDESPGLITGPDEDSMSYAEIRRYNELSERMCDKYKSLNVKKVEAIPLVPSPEPVQVNVSVCPPTTVPLVVGGKVVDIHEFPHMALLGWTKIKGGGYSWKCGGSLVSSRYVLTASHCAYQDKDDTVVIGGPRVVQLGSSQLDDPGALVVKVMTVIRHPKYIQTRSYYDVALLKLVEDVRFSEVIKPACLGEPPGVGEPIIATGWGRTEFGSGQSQELRSVSVPVWDMNDCSRVLGTSRKLPQGPSKDSQICAGEKNGGKDTCQGDSGGPAQVQDGCVWRVVAVTSVGRSCGAPNTPALYATIHKAFISAQIYGNEPNHNTNQPTERNTYNNRNNDNNSHNNNDYTITNVNNNRNSNNNREVTERNTHNNRNNEGNIYNSGYSNTNVNNNGNRNNNREVTEKNTHNNRNNEGNIYNSGYSSTNVNNNGNRNNNREVTEKNTHNNRNNEDNRYNNNDYSNINANNNRNSNNNREVTERNTHNNRDNESNIYNNNDYSNTNVNYNSNIANHNINRATERNTDNNRNNAENSYNNDYSTTNLNVNRNKNNNKVTERNRLNNRNENIQENNNPSNTHATFNRNSNNRQKIEFTTQNNRDNDYSIDSNNFDNTQVNFNGNNNRRNTLKNTRNSNEKNKNINSNYSNTRVNSDRNNNRQNEASEQRRNENNDHINNDRGNSFKENNNNNREVTNTHHINGNNNNDYVEIRNGYNKNNDRHNNYDKRNDNDRNHNINVFNGNSDNNDRSIITSFINNKNENNSNNRRNGYRVSTVTPNYQNDYDS